MGSLPDSLSAKKTLFKATGKTKRRKIKEEKNGFEQKKGLRTKRDRSCLSRKNRESRFSSKPRNVSMESCQLLKILKQAAADSASMKICPKLKIVMIDTRSLLKLWCQIEILIHPNTPLLFSFTASDHHLHPFQNRDAANV